MVSWINSNFAGWGSGIAIPGYGFIGLAARLWENEAYMQAIAE
jgi:gamma-glutamyltranspeptidase